MPSGSGMVPAAMLQSLLMLQKPLSAAFMCVERQRVDKARNAIVLEALKTRADYLLFIDDDNPVPHNTLVQFLEDDKDIIIAPILGRNPNKEGQHSLCAFYMEEGPVVDGKMLRLYNPIKEFRDSGPLHKIDAGGTGCMLIKRHVLEAMFKKYKDYMFEFGDVRVPEFSYKGKVYDRRTMSEDVEFCERAVDLGFEVYLDSRIRPFHIAGQKMLQWQGT